jgi:hypothetical protein
MGLPLRAAFAAIAACVGLGGSVVAAPARPAPEPKAAAQIVTFYVIRRTPEAWTVMDPATVEKVPGGSIRRAYSVTVRRNLLNGGPPQPGYVHTLNEYDCQARRLRWRSFTIYNRFGSTVVKQDNPDPAFVLPAPASEEETSLRTVCDGSRGGSAVAAPSMGQLVIGLMQAWDEAATGQALQTTAPDAARRPAGGARKGR